MSEHEPPPRPRFDVAVPLRMAFLDRDTWCDDCGGTIAACTPILAWPGDPARLIHDGGCPAPWTPEVINGTGEPTAQLALPLLAAVPEQETS